ncbi:MAG: hypothetical protein U0520_00685 [Candidatus Saccharimonadales bacterium]
MLQAKKRFWGKKPGFDMGDVLHIGVNVVFVAVIYAMITYWELVLLAALLVILSKWRIFAVQPRFWLPNIRANLVDSIVGIGSIVMIFQAPHEWLAVFWSLLYLVWLLFLKPQSSELWVGAQAFWAQLIGLSAIFMIPSFVKYPILICALTWLITWSAARHFFTNYEEPHYRTLGLSWGFLSTLLAWLSLHWLQYYVIFNTNLALMVCIISIVSVSLGSVYHSYKKEAVYKAVVLENGLFAAALLAIILITARWSARL